MTYKFLTNHTERWFRARSDRRLSKQPLLTRRSRSIWILYYSATSDWPLLLVTLGSLFRAYLFPSLLIYLIVGILLGPYGVGLIGARRRCLTPSCCSGNCGDCLCVRLRLENHSSAKAKGLGYHGAADWVVDADFNFALLPLGKCFRHDLGEEHWEQFWHLDPVLAGSPAHW